MKTIDILEYSLVVSTCIMLVYNFLITVLFPFKKKLLSEKENIQKLQKILMIFILVGMIIYVSTTNEIAPYLFITAWVWGFLASHIFIIRKRYWLNELLGLGILLAITIVLFFKQSDIIEPFIEQSDVSFIIYALCIISGVILGSLLWPKSIQE